MQSTEYGQERLKGVRKKRRKEEEETGNKRKRLEENVNLTATENEGPLKGVHRSFVIPGIPKAHINGSINQVKPHIRVLIEDQLKKFSSSK